MTDCQLIIDPPQRGSWNMAVDEWLLQRAADQGICTLRFYRWSEPTLSLGYFQAHADRQLHPPSVGLPMIRRASGGGALVHDHELTYSLAIPARNPLTRDSQALYDDAHVALVDALSSNLYGQSVPPEQRKISLFPHKNSGLSEEPFLCFLRRSKGDVIFSESSQSSVNLPCLGHKICGSAQRKVRGALLQHGGVLVSKSAYAPELSGLVELEPRCLQQTRLERKDAIEISMVYEWWIETLTERLGLNLTTGKPFSTDELATIDEIEVTKFGSCAWTLRR